MEPVFEPKTIHYLRQIFSKTIRREETAEATVPDGEPDPERVLCCSANAVLRSKECRVGSAELNGGIQADVLYLAGGEKLPRSLPVYLPFTVNADHSELEPESKLSVCVFVRGAEARIVHSRRIQVRVSLCLQIRAYADCEESIPFPSEIPAELQMKIVEYPMLLPVDYAETSFHIGEELSLPAGSREEPCVCFYTAEQRLTESRIAGDKAVFQGELRLHVLYKTEDGMLATFDRKLPFSQYCTLRDIHENGETEFCVVLTGCELHPDEDGTIRFETDLLVQCTVFDRVSATFCEDSFAVWGNWQPDWREYVFHDRLDRQTLGCMLRENIETPAASVLDVIAFRDVPKEDRAEGTLRLSVPITAEILCYDAEGELQRRILHAEPTAEMRLAPEAVFDSGVSIGEMTVQQTSAGLSVTCPIEISGCCLADRTYRSVSGGKLTEEPETEKRPAVILRRASAGDSIWELAKQYRSTVEKIKSANGMSEDALTESATVLIPT